MPKISIIIPTFNEASNLPLLLSDLSISKLDAEILIVDCNSKDKTTDIANIYGAKVLSSETRNRGLQLNIGANNALGDWFVFLHADSRFSQDWNTIIKRVLIDNKNFIYFFKFKVDDKKIIYRFLEILVYIRSYFFKKPYGDQGLIINRNIYFENKGYKKIPLMEDLDFIKRLINKENLRLLNFSIYTNSRKWQKTNIFLQSLKNWNLRRRWLKGESSESLYKEYYEN